LRTLALVALLIIVAAIVALLPFFGGLVDRRRAVFALLAFFYGEWVVEVMHCLRIMGFWMRGIETFANRFFLAFLWVGVTVGS
jgi:hypothetical protein